MTRAQGRTRSTISHKWQREDSYGSPDTVELSRQTSLAFAQALQSAARNVADRGDHLYISPVDAPKGIDAARPLRIGFFGNLANQAYISVRALRRLGYDVEIITQTNYIDSYA